MATKIKVPDAVASSSFQRSERVPSSFRDSHGFVFERDGRVFRSVDAHSYEILGRFKKSGLMDELLQERKIIPSGIVDPILFKLLTSEYPGYESFYEHEKITPITYPYEWSPSMLADAALITLELQIRLLGSGFSLQDASAYNIQFVKSKPIFIDLGSIENPRRLDIWYALGQFQRMFLYPLMLCRYRGWDLSSYFRTALDGQNLTQTAHKMGLFALLRPRLWLDISIPLLLERYRNQYITGAYINQRPKDPSPTFLVMNLRRLKKKIQKIIAGLRVPSGWADYTTNCSYDTDATSHKKKIIKDFFGRVSPKSVIDLGCNTGMFSFIAEESGAEVVAVDSDAGCIEHLYQQLSNKPRSITPIVMDLANPSPGIGFLNRERPSIFERIKADCVMALAILHHLMISANFSLAMVRDIFAALSKKYLVMEFIPREDAMFQKLIKFRNDCLGEYSIQIMISVFKEKFNLVQQFPILSTKRVLTIWELK